MRKPESTSRSHRLTPVQRSVLAALLDVPTVQMSVDALADARGHEKSYITIQVAKRLADRGLVELAPTSEKQLAGDNRSATIVKLTQLGMDAIS